MSEIDDVDKKYKFHMTLKRLDLRDVSPPFPYHHLHNMLNFNNNEHAWEWSWFDGMFNIYGEESRKPPNRWHRFWAWVVFGAKFKRLK